MPCKKTKKRNALGQAPPLLRQKTWRGKMVRVRKPTGVDTKSQVELSWWLFVPTKKTSPRKFRDERSTKQTKKCETTHQDNFHKLTSSKQNSPKNIKKWTIWRIVFQKLVNFIRGFSSLPGSDVFTPSCFFRKKQRFFLLRLRCFGPCVVGSNHIYLLAKTLSVLGVSAAGEKRGDRVSPALFCKRKKNTYIPISILKRTNKHIAKP